MKSNIGAALARVTKLLASTEFFVINEGSKKAMSGAKAGGPRWKWEVPLSSARVFDSEAEALAAMATIAKAEQRKWRLASRDEVTSLWEAGLSAVSYDDWRTSGPPEATDYQLFDDASRDLGKAHDNAGSGLGALTDGLDELESILNGLEGEPVEELNDILAKMKKHAAELDKLYDLFGEELDDQKANARNAERDEDEEDRRGGY
jgi:uncharacterized protein YukE